jgi:hypothetical protein
MSDMYLGNTEIEKAYIGDTLIYEKGGGGGGGYDISSLLTKQNLVSINAGILSGSPEEQVLNASNNFYVIDYGISQSKLRSVEFNFNGFSFKWNFPTPDHDGNYGYNLYGNTNLRLLATIGQVNFYIKLVNGYIFEFYIGNDLVGTVEGLD